MHKSTGSSSVRRANTLAIYTLFSLFTMSSMSGLFTRCRPLIVSAFITPRISRILTSKLQSPYLTRHFSYDERSEYAQSSWMDKNQEFLSPGDVAREKQKRRRNNKRKDEFNNETEKNFRQEFRGTRVFVQNIPEHIVWQDVSLFIWLDILDHCTFYV